MSEPVDPRKVRRRKVALSSLDDLARDLDAIEAAHAAGRLKRLGNHEPGAIFNHLAMAMERSFDGFGVRAAFPLRLIGPLVKGSVLRKPFQPGVRLRASDEQFAWNASVSFPDGLGQLRAGIGRAKQPGAKPAAAHPFFGSMTPVEWQVYYLRHAELHLSFLDWDRPSGAVGG